MDGVVAYFDANDIPGKNTYVSRSFPLIAEEEKIFLKKKSRIQYFNQPVGMIVAKSMETAKAAANLVRICYEDLKISSGCQFADIMESQDKNQMTVIVPAVDKIGTVFRMIL